MGLARLGDDETLRALAGDARWRVREGVAMGLQRYAAADRARLLALTTAWAGGSPLERRAAVATLAEPPLLRDPDVARAALDVLDRVTAGVADAADRRDDGFRALRKGLGYAWSVVVAALPDEGRPRFERWLDEPDRDVRWIVLENLRKARLERLDAAWVAECRRRADA
jgi:hypothetical protein